MACHNIALNWCMKRWCSEIGCMLQQLRLSCGCGLFFFLIWLQASTFVASIILSGCLKRISRCVIVSPLVLSNKCLIGMWRGKESVRVIQRKNTRREKCRNLTKYDNLDSQSVWQDILTFLNQTQRNAEGQKCWTSTYELKEWLVSRAVLMSSLCHLTFICWR